MLDCIIEFLNKWQTLITGLLALLAAIPTIYLLHKQISLSERHERTRRETTEAASRAVLPLTLSTIVDYAEQSSNTLHSLYQNRQGELIPERARAINVPPVPESAIASLQSMIEASTNPEVAKVIAKIIGKIQIQNSRIRSVIHQEQTVRTGHIVTTRNIEGYVIDSAMIRALAESMFSYARFESEEPEEVSWDNVSRSLRLMNWFDHIHADLYQTIARRRDRSALIE